MAIADVVGYLSGLQGKRVGLMGHQRPDGDALGSCVGLASVLNDNGIFTRVIMPDVIPMYISFLARGNGLVVTPENSDWFHEYDVIGVLDCGEANRVSPTNRAALSEKPFFNIDHHASSGGNFGEASWVWPGASSTGEMICDICRALDWKPNPVAADALWTAIVTDTGRFTQENTTVSCMEAALWCFRGGAEPWKVSTDLFQSVTFQERKLQRRVLDSMELHWNGKVALACLTPEDFLNTGNGVEGAQNLVSLLRDTVGVEIAVFIYEPPEAVDPKLPVKVSFRTRSPYDSLTVVTQFGGGGHQRAAGCSFPSGVTGARQAILDAIGAAWFEGEADPAMV